MPEIHDGRTLSEEEAARIIGPVLSDFLKAVSKVAKETGIEAFALWTYHHGTMRVTSAGTDGKGREIGRMIALMMQEQNIAILESMERNAKGERSS